MRSDLVDVPGFDGHSFTTDLKANCTMVYNEAVHDVRGEIDRRPTSGRRVQLSVLRELSTKHSNIMAYRHILDNCTHTVSDYLRSNLQGGDVFRLVSAYFSIYGYEQVEDALNSVDKVRFLYGDPTSVDDVDPGEAEPKSFDVTERGLSPRHTLNQKGNYVPAYTGLKLV